MIKAFSPLKALNTYLKCQEIKTDNFAFRVHCILTTVILLVCSIALTSIQLIGKPIECLGSEEKFLKPITTYCWTTTTYSMPEDFRKKVGTEVAAPGVGTGTGNTEWKKYYTYYQWVCFVLFLQAIMCYVPKCILDMCEGGLIAKLATGMNAFCPATEQEKKKKSIVQYLRRYHGEHKCYTMGTWGCEVLCLANVLGQMWLMDAFLDGQFWSYGTKVLQHSNLPQYERLDPMIYIFPRMTKCLFKKFGPTGTIEIRDYLCILPQNVVNEKIYIFLWFWYILLAVILSLLIIVRLLMLFVPNLRARLLRIRSRNLVSMETATLVTRATDFGDWWLLYRLSQNMDMFIYRDLISQYAKSLIGKKSLNPDHRASFHAYSYIPCPLPPNNFK